MKRLRAALLLAVTVGLLAGALVWTRRTATKGAATPAECLDNFYESFQSGDVENYLNCLGEPYRTEAGAASFDAARRDRKDVKNRVHVAGPVEEGPTVWLDVDEVRAAGVRRLRYHLRPTGAGWVIAAIDPPREIAVPIRYGTPVSDEP